MVVNLSLLIVYMELVFLLIHTTAFISNNSSVHFSVFVVYLTARRLCKDAMKIYHNKV